MPLQSAAKDKSQKLAKMLSLSWRKTKRSRKCPIGDGDSPSEAQTASTSVNSQGLPGIISDFALWRRTADQHVANLRQRIDDMWLDELMLGCDTELYTCVRQAAIDIDAGATREDAIARARAAAKETEAMALQSLKTRFEARDCVTRAGGLEAMERRAKDQRSQTTSCVMPYIEQLADPRRVDVVRQTMEEFLEVAQEEYEEKNAQKTAKAEVMIELQDEESKREWMNRQLADALDILELSNLVTTVLVQDVADFFVEAVGCGSISKALRARAYTCLEGLRHWGAGATQALERLQVVEVAVDLSADSSTDSPAAAFEESTVSIGHDDQLDGSETSSTLETAATISMVSPQGRTLLSSAVLGLPDRLAHNDSSSRPFAFASRSEAASEPCAGDVRSPQSCGEVNEGINALVRARRQFAESDHGSGRDIYVDDARCSPLLPRGHANEPGSDISRILVVVEDR